MTEEAAGVGEGIDRPGHRPGAAPVRPGNRRGRDTNQRIWSVATRLFEQRGLDLTIDELAREAATTRMTVHRHVGSREALITRLVLRASAELAEDLRAVLDRPGPLDGRLADAIVHTVVGIRARPHLAGMFTTDLSGAWPTVDPDDRVVGVVRQFFRPYLERAASDSLLGADSEEVLSWLLNQTLLLLLVPSIAPTEHDVRHQVVGFVLPAVLRT